MIVNKNNVLYERRHTMSRLDFGLYSDILDEIKLSEDITCALMENEVEDFTVAINKHIGHCIKIITETHKIDKARINDFLLALISEYNHAYPCIHVAEDTAREVSHRIILFISNFTEFSPEILTL